MSAYSEILSTIALVVSAGSLTLSGLSAFRDRPRLKITSKYVDASEYDENDSIWVVVVNRGRRPVILRLVGGTARDGQYGGEFLEYDKGGLRLGEHERYEKSIKADDAISFNPEGPDLLFERMWIEDSLGNRHEIPKSREFIAKLRRHADAEKR
jgi:hypothetical protein